MSVAQRGSFGRRSSLGPLGEGGFGAASPTLQLMLAAQCESALQVNTQVSMPQQTFDDLIDSMSVQMFTPDQISVMIAGSELSQVENRDVFNGSYKGVRVRVWKVAISHSVSYLELKRAYSKYCIAHPNICAVLGVCIQADPDDLQQQQQQQLEEEAQLGLGPQARGTDQDQHATPRLHNLAPLREWQPSTQQQQQRSPRVSPRQQQQQQQQQQQRELESQSPDQQRRRTSSSYVEDQLQQDDDDACQSPTCSHDTDMDGYNGRHWLWVVEESFGEETLHTRLERGLLSWQQVVKISTNIAKALAFLQDLRRNSGQDVATPPATLPSDDIMPGDDSMAMNSGAVLSAYALRTIVTPSNVQMDAQITKVSVLPALLNHLESALGPDPSTLVPPAAPITPLHCDMAYIDPHSLFSEGSAPSFYAFGVVLAQLLTEQGPLGLLSAVKEALESNTLINLVPRLPANAAMVEWASSFSRLALKCSQPGGISSLEQEVLPVLDELGARLAQLGSSTMSWEQVEEMLMLPLQPRAPGDLAHRRWVRQDFRMRRKLFLDEVAKLAVEGPIHKIEIRRARCFKDSIAVFAGKGHAVWRQPLKVTFIGEAGMDSGGVTREWFSALSSSISRGSPELFWSVGPQKNQLYINPLSSTPSHLKKFHFVGMFMAKAILESAARGKELGSITLSLAFCEPFWKLLLGMPLNLIDLQLLDPTEFRSLMSILDMDIDGLIFETFAWNFHHASAAAAAAAAAAAQAAVPLPHPSIPASSSHDGVGPSGSGTNTPTKAPQASAASPFSGADTAEDSVSSIPLKPGGSHLKVTNHNKREYVLLKAHKMLVGTVEAQMTAIIDAFHSLIPRELMDKYQFTSLELQLLVCGEQRIDVQDLRRSCKYEDGFTGTEDVIAWFWEVADGLDDTQRRQLLQFWSGSDGMPAEGFGALDPAFHIVAVERMYDANDTTARLPAAHTCFRQLDLPRYKSIEELKEKLLTAITIGQGYMALS